MSRFDLADDEVVVWRYQRGIDDAWLYHEDRFALDYEDEYDSEPEQVIVKRQWYETLPEDPGP